MLALNAGARGKATNQKVVTPGLGGDVTIPKRAVSDKLSENLSLPAGHKCPGAAAATIIILVCLIRVEDSMFDVADQFPTHYCPFAARCRTIVLIATR